MAVETVVLSLEFKVDSSFYLQRSLPADLRIFVGAMPIFYPLRVADIVRETPHAVSLYFDVPPRLQKRFTYKAGQYLTIKHAIGGVEIQRSYSLSAAPGKGIWRIGIKSAGKGGFSAYANRDLKVGETLCVSPPQGRFTLRYKPDEKRTLLFFAAGSGITPIHSLVKEVLMREKGAGVWLFYANPNAAETLYRNEILDLKKRYERFFPYFFYTRENRGDAFYKGRLSRDKLALITNQLLDFDEVDQAFICGPEALIVELAQALLARGLPKPAIHFELFAEPTDPFFSAWGTGDRQSLANAKVLLQLDGETCEFEMNPQAESILDAALNSGIDAPHSCKGGTCATCTCTLLKGKVTLRHNLVLTDADLQAGKILACQAHPTTDYVEIEFD
ncbi:MAG: 2Fe-2S iron-sulfur cluster-binding protein [Flavobacteriales bacterium]